MSLYSNVPVFNFRLPVAAFAVAPVKFVFDSVFIVRPFAAYKLVCWFTQAPFPFVCPKFALAPYSLPCSKDIPAPRLKPYSKYLFCSDSTLRLLPVFIVSSSAIRFAPAMSVSCYVFIFMSVPVIRALL